MLTCCCVTDCIIAEDDFNRANETPVGAPWSLVDNDGAEGTLPNLVSNALDVNSLTRIKHAAADPRGVGYDTEVEADFTADALDGGIWRAGLIIGLKDAGGPSQDTYYGCYLYYDGDCFYLTLGYRGVSGIDTFTCNPGNPGCIPLPGFTLGQTYHLQLCLKPNQGSYGYETYDLLRATVTNTNWPEPKKFGTTNVFDGAPDGDKAGTIVLNGQATVDNFKYKYFKESPDHRTCPNCNTQCHIATDPFDADDWCWWTAVDGSYSIHDGIFEITDDDSWIRFELPHPQLKTCLIASGRLSADAIVHRVKLEGGGYFEWDGQLRLYDAADVLLETRDPDEAFVADSDGMYNFQLCYSHLGILTATVYDNSNHSVCCQELADEVVSGIYAFLGGDDGATFDDFVLAKHYSQDEPTDSGCDECECEPPPPDCFTYCCDDPVPPEFIVIDLGVGGWTAASTCDDCELLAGEVVAEVDNDCFYNYVSYTVSCPPNTPGEANGGVVLLIDQDGTGCRWKATVSMGDTVGASSVAVYYSDYFADRASCSNFPYALTKDSESHDTTCTGTLPTTITIDEA